MRAPVGRPWTGGCEPELNSLGSSEERARHREALIAYLEQHQDALDEDGKRRLHTNPLRILDTKNPALQALVEAAPRLIDYLGEESLRHFEGVQLLLKDAGIPYRINPRLVRGLDYYNRTVFEWVTTRLGAQGTICAGALRWPGRAAWRQAGAGCGLRDGRGADSRTVAGVGWRARQGRPRSLCGASGEAATRLAFRAAEALRGHGFATLLHCGGGSFKSQMKKADASGAPFALVIGEDEAAAGEVTLKPMRGGEQRRVSLDELAPALADQLFALDGDDGGL